MARTRRYSDKALLAELRASAARLGRSPTMREFRLDSKAVPHPQTYVVRFGSWNAPKRNSGLVARRYATRRELAEQPRALGEKLGSIPTGVDVSGRRAETAWRPR